MASRLVKVRAVRAIGFRRYLTRKGSRRARLRMGEGRNIQLCTKLVSYDQNLRHFLGLSPWSSGTTRDVGLIGEPALDRDISPLSCHSCELGGRLRFRGPAEVRWALL